jgi:predicted phosphodiesterase
MFFGDPHGDLNPVIAAVEHFQPEAIVLLGDIQARRPLHVELRPILDLTEIWFIHGNHDTDSDADYDNLWGSSDLLSLQRDAIYLDDDSNRRRIRIARPKTDEHQNLPIAHKLAPLC